MVRGWHPKLRLHPVASWDAQQSVCSHGDDDALISVMKVFRALCEMYHTPVPSVYLAHEPPAWMACDDVEWSYMGPDVHMWKCLAYYRMTLV